MGEPLLNLLPFRHPIGAHCRHAGARGPGLGSLRGPLPVTGRDVGCLEEAQGGFDVSLPATAGGDRGGEALGGGERSPLPATEGLEGGEQLATGGEGHPLPATERATGGKWVAAKGSVLLNGSSCSARRQPPFVKLAMTRPPIRKRTQSARRPRSGQKRQMPVRGRLLWFLRAFGFSGFECSGEGVKPDHAGMWPHSGQRLGVARRSYWQLG